MDPNEVLRRIRELLAGYVPGRISVEDHGALVDAVCSLDEWLSKQGFLPEAWAQGRVEAEVTLENAKRIHEQDYWQDVQGAADEIGSWVKEQHEKGTREEDLREALYEHVNELVDSHARVIYVVQAQECLLFSRHDGAAVEEGLFGVNDFEDGIPWSAMASAAFRHDIYAELDRRGQNMDTPEEWVDYDVEDEN